MEPDQQRAIVGDNGASVNIRINDSFKLRWVHYLVVCSCLGLSIYSCVTVYFYGKQVEELKTEARLWQYWGERAEIAAEKQGVKLPALPGK